MHAFVINIADTREVALAARAIACVLKFWQHTEQHEPAFFVGCHDTPAFEVAKEKLKKFKHLYLATTKWQTKDLYKIQASCNATGVFTLAPSALLVKPEAFTRIADLSGTCFMAFEKSDCVQYFSARGLRYYHDAETDVPAREFFASDNKKGLPTYGTIIPETMVAKTFAESNNEKTIVIDDSEKLFCSCLNDLPKWTTKQTFPQKTFAVLIHTFPPDFEDAQTAINTLLSNWHKTKQQTPAIFISVDKKDVPAAKTAFPQCEIYQRTGDAGGHLQGFEAIKFEQEEFIYLLSRFDFVIKMDSDCQLHKPELYTEAATQLGIEVVGLMQAREKLRGNAVPYGICYLASQKLKDKLLSISDDEIKNLCNKINGHEDIFFGKLMTQHAPQMTYCSIAPRYYQHLKFKTQQPEPHHVLTCYNSRKDS